MRVLGYYENEYKYDSFMIINELLLTFRFLLYSLLYKRADFRRLGDKKTLKI